jgi:hypothetical protein
MKPQYSHNLITSVTLWLDHLICASGEAYTNITGSLYRQGTSNGRTIYASPYRSWVYDSCTPGAVVPSGFYNSAGQFLTRESGLVLDFINGRVFSSQNWGDTLSGVYAKKQVNVYFSSDEEIDFVLEAVNGENRNISYTLTGLRNNVLVAPLIMLTNAHEINVPFALGGIEDTKNSVRAFVLTDSNYLQEGVNSLCRDTSDTYIPFCSYADAPITSSGDIKGGRYSYCTDIKDRYGCANGLFVDKVVGYKLDEKANKSPTFLISILEFDISKIRGV